MGKVVILSCPWCGSAGELCECDAGWYVRCSQECLSQIDSDKPYCWMMPSTGVGDNPQSVIELWNTRTKPQN